jgi:hypothetical protein
LDLVTDFNPKQFELTIGGGFDRDFDLHRFDDHYFVATFDASARIESEADDSADCRAFQIHKADDPSIFTRFQWFGKLPMFGKETRGAPKLCDIRSPCRTVTDQTIDLSPLAACETEDERGMWLGLGDESVVEVEFCSVSMVA